MFKTKNCSGSQEELYKPFLSFSAPKPKIYTGIVKYVGVLDRQDYSRRVYVGVRLDSPGKCNLYYCIGGVMVGVLTLSAKTPTYFTIPV
jgi:hypothetical protein